MCAVVSRTRTTRTNANINKAQHRYLSHSCTQTRRTHTSKGLPPPRPLPPKILLPKTTHKRMLQMMTTLFSSSCEMRAGNWARHLSFTRGYAALFTHTPITFTILCGNRFISKPQFSNCRNLCVVRFRVRLVFGSNIYLSTQLLHSHNCFPTPSASNAYITVNSEKRDRKPQVFRTFESSIKHKLKAAR